MDIIEQMNDLRVELESLEFVDWVLFDDLWVSSVFYSSSDVIPFMVRFWGSGDGDRNEKLLESVIRGFGDILEHFSICSCVDGVDVWFDIYILKVI